MLLTLKRRNMTVCSVECPFRDDSLNKHTRNNHDEQKGLMCEKSFSQLSNLKSHTISHTRERGYACLLCEKSFLLSSHLKRHKNNHANQTVTMA